MKIIKKSFLIWVQEKYLEKISFVINFLILTLLNVSQPSFQFIKSKRVIL